MDNIFGVFYRTILAGVVLFLVAKMMGKKQISQLNLFDYIIGITIGSIAADISLDLEKNLISGILSMFLYGLASYIISIVTLRSISLRRIFNGVPTVLVEKGEIIQSGFDKSKIDINEFLSQARINGYFDLNEIDYAIMEINGSISFLPNEKDKPVNKKDMKIKCKNKGLTANIIIDGNYMFNNMKAIGKDREWLNHELDVQGIKDYNEVLLATCDDNYQVHIYKRGVKPDKNTILE